MPVKIVMVCLGNICRSPLAQGILAAKLPSEKFLIDSAGMGSWHIGHAPDKRSIAVAQEHNISIEHQKGRQFSAKDFNDFDYIYAMDITNYDDIIAMAKNDVQKNKVHMILNELFPDENVDVPDPYYGLTNGFENVYQMLDEACEVLAEKLIKKHT